MAEEASKQYRRSEHVEDSKVGDRLVLYHRESRKALVLNPTGSWLWQLLTTAHTTQTLAEQLRARFPGLSWEQAVSDVSTFLDELLQHGVVFVEE